MNKKNQLNGFSLIEIMVVIGIFCLLMSSAILIGFPEYDRYTLFSERGYLFDTLLESRTRSFVGGAQYTVQIWSNGYCIQDRSGLCVVPAHSLPSNMYIFNISTATSTQMLLGFVNEGSKNLLQTEINIDQNGYIDGR